MRVAGRPTRWRIVRVDLAARSVRMDELDEAFVRQFPGGALLASRLILEAAGAPTDPLDPRLPLVVAGTVLAGHAGPGLARCSFVAWSPLVPGLAEARTEGPFGVALGRSGVLALVIAGGADRPISVVVGRHGVRLEDAADLWGLGAPDVADAAGRRFGPGRVAAIGPSGERLVRFAAVVTDRSFVAARGGIGAVMGAKRLKAIVLTETGFAENAADPASLRRIARAYASQSALNPLTRWQHDRPGFATWVGSARPGTFAVENYRTSRTGPRGSLAAWHLDRFLAWDGSCCPGCPTNCVKGFASSPRRRTRAAADRSGGLHQEALAALGPNLGLGSAARVLALHERTLDLALDPVSLGFTLSFALEAREAGLLGDADLVAANASPPRFGSFGAIATMVEAIGRRDGPAGWLAEGAARSAAAVGGPATALAMTVKGLELGVFEPRTSPMIALGYALSPTGPRYDFVEHDADFDDVAPSWPHVLDLSAPLGLGAPFPMTSLTPAKAAAFAALTELWSAFDALGVCLFAAAPTRPLSLDAVVGLVAAITGWDVDAAEVRSWGRARLALLRLAGLWAGLSAADDVLPERFFREPIDAGPFGGTVLDRTAFVAARSDAYRHFGWDEAGRPSAGTLGAAGVAIGAGA